MDLATFALSVRDFDALTDRDRIRHFAWYLCHHCEVREFATADIRKCFEQLQLLPPNVSLHLSRMAASKPPSLIRRKQRYQLHRNEMMKLNALYVAHPATIAASTLLTKLPTKVPNLSERAFLDEAINCYKVKAYRAAIVMTWNLAYDHLLRWILVNPERLTTFNTALAKRLLKNCPNVASREDFESIKEVILVEVCGTAGLLSSNLVKILKEKLTKRNMAAHPSTVVILESQANDVITDLINNIVLALECEVPTKLRVNHT